MADEGNKMLRGLNATCTIQRRTQAADDVVGGAVVTFVNEYENVLCRIASIKPAYIDVADQGLETLKPFQIIVWPARYVILEGDKLIVTSPVTHPFFSVEFLIVSVMIDSISPSDARGHIELFVNRYEQARSIA